MPQRSRVLLATVAAFVAVSGFLALVAPGEDAGPASADQETPSPPPAAPESPVPDSTGPDSAGPDGSDPADSGPAGLDPAGLGETLVLVIGGVHRTAPAAEAEAAASGRHLQGYYVARTGQFRLTAAYADARTDEEARTNASDAPLVQVPLTGAEASRLAAGRWMTVSAFRTRDGAEQFVAYMRSMEQHEPALVVQAVRVSGSSPIGLGSEADPDGSGPALDELPGQEALQR